MSALNLILIGPPGAGKGTQAEHIKEDFDLPYLATGDMMRAKRKEDSELGRKIDQDHQRGRPRRRRHRLRGPHRAHREGGRGRLPARRLPAHQGPGRHPRRGLSERGRTITAVLLIEAPDETIVARLTGRRQCPDGHVYHLEFNPPKEEGVCDIDGKPLEQRDDDKPETVSKRLATYHEQTEPLVERYDDEGLLRRFDGTQSPDEVHEHLRARPIDRRLAARGRRSSALRATACDHAVIVKKSPAEIDAMAAAGVIHTKVLDLLARKIRPGVTTRSSTRRPRS